MTKKTFSLIGAGRMGKNHLQAALDLGMEISAVYDINLSSLENISSVVPTSTLLTNDFDKFANLPASDITAIATTAPSHSKFIEDLAFAGRRVMVCEKPLATSVSELSRISELVKMHELKIAVNHQMRFMDQYRLVKDLQKEHKLGELCTMSVNGANFGLGMNATHYVEAFYWLSGDEIAKVSGDVRRQGRPNVRGNEFYDYAGHMVLHGLSGSILFLDFQEKLSHHVLVVYNFEFGKIVVNELLGTLTIDSRLEHDLTEPSFRYGLSNNHIQAQIQPAELIKSTTELYAKVLEGSDYPTHRDGERTVRSALAAILSTELNGLPVKLSDSRLGQMENLTWP
jgi:predicted dehydrogenase